VTTVECLAIFVEKFQTLLTGILAIVAAAVAFWGTVRAANIQARAGHAQAAATLKAMQEQLNHQSNQEILERSRAREEFKTMILLCTAYFRKQLQLNKAIMRKTIRVEGALSEHSIEMLHVNLHPILLSGWKELSLLTPQMMEQVIRLQSVAASINTMVDRLRDDTMRARVVSSDILDDLEEHFDMALRYISEFVPDHFDPTKD
jgi:hypothetical protein